jgi:hypothetical protein
MYLSEYPRVFSIAFPGPQKQVLGAPRAKMQGLQKNPPFSHYTNRKPVRSRNTPPSPTTLSLKLFPEEQLYLKVLDGLERVRARRQRLPEKISAGDADLFEAETSPSSRRRRRRRRRRRSRRGRRRRRGRGRSGGGSGGCARGGTQRHDGGFKWRTPSRARTVEEQNFQKSNSFQCNVVVVILPFV